MNILNGLCALPWKYYAADIVAVIFFIVMTVVGGKKGFINSFFGIVSTFVAFLLAVTLAKSMLDLTNGLFGLEGWLSGKLQRTFAKLEGFTVDISGNTVETALEMGDVSAVFAYMVLKSVGKQQTLPAGTTLASLVGGSVGRFAATIVCGIIIFTVVKLLMLIVRKALDGIASRISLLNGLNALLGTVFGFFRALLMISVVFAVLSLFSFAWLESYLSQTLFLGALYENNPIIVILGWFI